MTRVQVKLLRYDREPGPDHEYGDHLDELIDKAVGGASKLDRAGGNPKARVPGSKAHLELHEDGPLLQTVIEQIPALMSATASLITAWCAWRSTRKDVPPAIRKATRRTVRVSVGNHSYEGQLAPKDVKRVAMLLASLDRRGV